MAIEILESIDSPLLRPPLRASPRIKAAFEKVKYSRSTYSLAHSIACALRLQYQIELACIVLKQADLSEGSRPSLVCVSHSDSSQDKPIEQKMLSTIITSVSGHEVINNHLLNHKCKILQIEIGTHSTISVSTEPNYEGYILLMWPKNRRIKRLLTRDKEQIASLTSQLLVGALQQEVASGIWLSFLHDVKHYAHRAELINYKLSNESAPAQSEKLFRLANIGNADLVRKTEAISLVCKYNSYGYQTQVKEIHPRKNILEVIKNQQQSFVLKGVELKTPEVCLSGGQQTEDHKCVADPELLEIALNNLIGNALRHTSAGGVVSVLIDRLSDWIKISVVNQGPPLDPEEENRIRHLFETPYLMAAGQPRGLGLISCKLVTELLGGKITLETDQENKTIFSLWLKANVG